MFDPKSTEAFRQIKAPDGLAERVLCKSHRKALRFSTDWTRWVAAAIALVFLAVGGNLLSPESVNVTVDGLSVEEQAVALPNAASAPMMRGLQTQTADLAFDRDTTVLSADGLLLDKEGLPLTLPCTVKADTPVFWEVVPMQETFFLTAETKGETIQLCLTYEENNWSIKKEILK